MIAQLLEDYAWRSQALLAAELAPDGTVRRANAALQRLAGRTLTGEPLAALVTPAQRDAFARRLERAVEHWTPATFAFAGDPARPATDRRVWTCRVGERIAVVAEPVPDEQERLVEKALELNDGLVDAHRELVRQREALRTARAAAEASAEQLRRLEAVATAGLAEPDLDGLLDHVLRAIADAAGARHAVVFLLDPEGGVLRARAGVGHHGEAAVGRTVALGQGVTGQIAAEARPRVVPAGGGTLAGVPLTLDGTLIGVLEVGTEEPGAFTEGAVPLLVAAAERAALAIGRAQLLERERRIAETLQRALLPDRLPHVPGVVLASRFEPSADTEVGGDWYDVLPLDGGELLLVMGDVAGKGVPAAALMGELRAGLRAYAIEDGSPLSILRRLDRLVQRSSHMATVFVATLDPASGALRHASAGHLPALVLEPGGGTRFLRDGASTPLLAFDAGVAEGATVLAPGARLVLYTDGLVERRGEAIDRSLEGLRDAAAAWDGPLEGLPDHLVATLSPPPGSQRDDVAVLALERAGERPAG